MENNLTSITQCGEGPDDQFEEFRFPGLAKFGSDYSNIHGYVAAVVCVWGTVANLANIIVLTRKNMISPINHILTWLAVADLMTMISYFPISIHFYIMRPCYLPFPSSQTYQWVVFMIFQINFSVVCHTIAIWLTIALAIFRYLYICHPPRAKIYCTIRRAKITILAVYVTTAFMCTTNYLATEIKEYAKLYVAYSQDHVNLQNFTLHYYTIGAIRNETFLSVNYWIQSILVKLLPCALLTVLTILLILAMHKANRRRMKLMSQGRKGESEREHETNRTTGMLLAIVALFLITELPQGLLTLASIFAKWIFKDVYIPIADLFDITALLNNSINFVLYCTMSRQFRNTFANVFCCHGKLRRPEWMKVTAFHAVKDEDGEELANGITAKASVTSATSATIAGDNQIAASV